MTQLSIPTIVDIKSVSRRVRGGSQACLVEGSDGAFYVAKFTGNPQGTRTLINEWIYTQLSRRLGISTPEVTFLRLPPSLRDVPKDFQFQQASSCAIVPGVHIGSMCPVNPNLVAIFDFLPDKMLTKIVNPEDWWRVLVLDIFVGQSDSRQVIFIRDKTIKRSMFRSDARDNVVFRAYHIDHGQAFGGASWTLPNCPLRPVYFRRTVYDESLREINVKAAISKLRQVSSNHIQEVCDQVPVQWWDKDDIRDLPKLCRQLQTQQSILEDLVDLVWQNKIKQASKAQPSAEPLQANILAPSLMY